MAYFPKFYGKAIGHKFIFEKREDFDFYMEKYPDGTDLEMTVKRKYKKRTSGQPGEDTDFNGYYWAVIVAMIADEIGEADRQAVHEWIQLSIGNVKRMPDGREIAGDTSDMSGGEFADMCSRARTWAGTATDVFGESGLCIPQPHEVSY